MLGWIVRSNSFVSRCAGRVCLIGPVQGVDVDLERTARSATSGPPGCTGLSLEPRQSCASLQMGPRVRISTNIDKRALKLDSNCDSAPRMVGADHIRSAIGT